MTIASPAEHVSPFVLLNLFQKVISITSIRTHVSTAEAALRFALTTLSTRVTDVGTQ